MPRKQLEELVVDELEARLLRERPEKHDHAHHAFVHAEGHHGCRVAERTAARISFTDADLARLERPATIPSWLESGFRPSAGIPSEAIGTSSLPSSLARYTP